MTNTDLLHGLRGDRRSLTTLRAQIRRLERGGHVENLSLKHARQIERSLLQTIANKERLLASKARLLADPRPRRRPAPRSFVPTGCGCERGSTCTIPHNPSTCPCRQCRAASRGAARGHDLRSWTKKMKRPLKRGSLKNLRRR